MNILGGVVKKDSGSIVFEGKPFDPKTPSDARKAGIAFIHQELNLFTNLSVKENMYIEDFPKGKVLNTLDYKYMKSKSKEVLNSIGEDINVDVTVGSLNMGHRQMIEIAKALTREVKIIIFDEPTTSLSIKEKEKLFKTIKELSEKGVSVIYISHVIEDIFELCQEIAVLRDGKLIGQYPAEEVDKDKIISMMVGRELTKLFPYEERPIGDVVYKVDNLNQEGRLKEINIELREGEIVGLFGLMGAGRSEFARAIFGIDAFNSGEVFIKGQNIKDPDPGSCINEGICFITENRREEGLLMDKSVHDNLLLVTIKDITKRFSVVDKKRGDENSDKVIEEVKIKTFDKHRQIVRNLSGGNQQKVVIGKWLLAEPKVFILDEPTRGIDVGAKYEIYQYINNLAKNKSTILFISSEMEELMGVCDKIVVMSDGQISGEISRDEFDQEVLLKLAMGGELSA
jgi:ABC-type sugar transport system ATPase subunit